MTSFEQGGFTTYDELQEGRDPFCYPEQSIADGVAIGNENSFDDIAEGEDVFAGLENSGVVIEPFHQFYSDGITPELSSK